MAISSVDFLRVLSASAVNTPDSFHHRDAEYAEGLFMAISSVDFLRVLSASAVNTPDSFHHRDTEYAEVTSAASAPPR
jgi:hypothetical protein